MKGMKKIQVLVLKRMFIFRILQEPLEIVNERQKLIFFPFSVPYSKRLISSNLKRTLLSILTSSLGETNRTDLDHGGDEIGAIPRN